ncbi:hypothetical protein AB6825_22735 [Serratia proteamaculans]|uniref:hypothetical protein n=1 Tax=Serratia proteamaculans TaxID=28151 RepID=UPI0039BE721B
MTQTLTTEAMQEIYEAAVHSEASGSQEAEFELLCKLEDIGGTSATIRKLIDMVRAANREAQPVTSVIPDIGSTVVNDAAWKLYNTLTEYGPLNGRQFNNLKCCLYEALKIVMNAPPAPAVPDNLAAAVNRLLDYDGTRGHFSAIRCSDAREEVERLLAQPVSQGYKLPADWRLDESTGAKILMYKDCSVIEDQQAEYVLSLIQAAAPEGGNG